MKRYDLVLMVLVCLAPTAVTGLGVYLTLAARQQAESAVEVASHDRARRVQSERDLDKCINMIQDTVKVEDRCQRKLRRCQGVEEFGK